MIDIESFGYSKLLSKNYSEIDRDIFLNQYKIFGWINKHIENNESIHHGILFYGMLWF